PLRIRDALRNEVIHTGHYVLIVGLTPGVHDHPLARFSVTSAAARHGKQHGKSRARHCFSRIWINLRHKVHELWKQSISNAAARAAMNVDEQWQQVACGPSRRSQQQPPDLHPVERSPTDWF